MAHSIVQEKSYAFALMIIALYIEMQKQREFVLSKQLLRCGTSIGANVEEALAAQSKADFISKMSIASKEARETHYWLRLLRDSQLVSINVDGELKHAAELKKMLSAIVKSSQENQ